MEDGFNLTDFAFLELEHLGELPSPGIRRTAGHGAACRRLVCAVGTQCVVEEGKAEHQTTLPIDSDIAAIPDPPHKVDQAGFKLLLTAPVRRIGSRSPRIR